MSARDLLANATPRPWSWNADEWSIVGARNEQAIVGGPDETLIFIAPNIRLAIDAVNEYEALLDLEAHMRNTFAGWNGKSRELLACLDALRADLSPVNAEPAASLAKATAGSDKEAL